MNIKITDLHDRKLFRDKVHKVIFGEENERQRRQYRTQSKQVNIVILMQFTVWSLYRSARDFSFFLLSVVSTH